VLGSTTFVGWRMTTQEALWGGRILIMAGALVSWWLLRRGNEVRVRWTLTDRALHWSLGRTRTQLAFDDIASLDYDAPFATRGYWLPAWTLHDRQGRVWRVSALIGRAPELLAALLQRSGRSDLAAWAESRSVASRLRRARVLIGWAYGLSLGLVVAAAVVGLR